MSELHIIDDTIPPIERYARQSTESEFIMGLQAIDINSDSTPGILVHNPKEGFGFIYQGDAHTLVCGTSGSGKSKGTLGPNLIHWSHTGAPAIVFDPKAELLAISARDFEAHGYDVKILDFNEPYRGCRFNPLYEPVVCLRSEDPILRDHGESMLLELFTSLIIAGSPNQDDFWTRPGINYLIGLTKILISRMDDDQFLTLKQLKEAFNRSVASMEDIKRLEKTLQPNDPILLDLMGISRTTADATRSGLIAMVNKGLALADTSGMSDLISENDVDIHDLTSGKSIVLFIIPSDTSPTLDFMVATILRNMIATIYHDADHVYHGRLSRPILMMIDEFANIPPIPSFSKVITNSRSRNINIVFAVQSVAQLESVYGASAATIIDNCRNIIATNGDAGLVTLIDRRIGLSSSGEDIITVNMLRSLTAGSALVVLDGKNPFIASFRLVFGSHYEIPFRKPSNIVTLDLERLLFETSSETHDEEISIQSLLAKASYLTELEGLVLTNAHDLRLGVAYWCICKGVYDGRAIRVSSLRRFLDKSSYLITFGDAIRMVILAVSTDPEQFITDLIEREIYLKEDFPELVSLVTEIRKQFPFLKGATHLV